MNKGKRNIQQHADKEVKHLMVLLDKSDASEFKAMVPELQDTWIKNSYIERKLKCVSQFYRTISMELMPRNIGNPFENKIPTLTI